MELYKCGIIKGVRFVRKLIRREITFKIMNDSIINYNYYYSITQILYRAFSIINPQKAKEIHDNGIACKDKNLRLFNFHIFFKDANFGADGIRVREGDTVNLVISGIEFIVQNIEKGLITEENIQLFYTELKLLSIRSKSAQLLKNTTLYKLNSPIICMASTKHNVTKGDKVFKNYYDYKSPFSSEFYELTAKNLKRKYEAVYGQQYSGALSFNIDNTYEIRKKRIGGIKNKYFKKGYVFNLWIETDIKMQKIAYYLGVGSHNSLGAGFLTFIKGLPEGRAINE